MKKRFRIFTAAVCAISATAMLASCGALKDFDWKFWEKNEEPTGDDKPTQLLAPELSANDEGIFWTEVAYAEGYKIKLGGGEWQTVSADTRSYDFPETTGEYTFSVVATAKEIAESKTATLGFGVKQAAASVTQTDNVLSFTGDNIYYSVNGGEEGALFENKLLDFSSAAVGSEYAIEYYTKGGYWVESEKAYYVDGDKQLTTLTVTATLSAPTLAVNAEGTGLTWQAVENGGGYEITVDGVTTTISATDAREVSFPKTLGEHVITVRATENGDYKRSEASSFIMTTATAGVPEVTYDELNGVIVWDEKYAELMTAANGGGFAAVNDSKITYAEGLKLKLVEHYDAFNATLYLESKPLSFAIRQTPQITFEKSGAISWNPDDEGAAKNYYYSLTPSGEAADFAATQANAMDVSAYAEGEYSLTVYAAKYLDENGVAATLYLPSERAAITFKTLEKPTLSYTTGKLLWIIDENATGYEITTDGASWDEAALDGEYEVSEFTAYSVRAIGSEAVGAYAVTSQTSTIFFDPSLSENDDSIDIANFNDEKYLQNVGTSREGNTTSGGIQSVITTSENAAEQGILAGANGGVLKLTASNAAPKNVNTWGNFDGICFNFFKPISGAKGGKILVRVYMTSNPNRAYLGEDDDTTDTVGGWQAVATENKDENGYTIYERQAADIEGRVTYELHRANGTSYNFWKKTIKVDGWTEIVMDVPSEWSTEEITGFSLNFHENGQAGDVIYIDEIQWFTPSISARTIEFDTDELQAKKFAYGFSGKNGVELVKDTVNGEEKTVLKANRVWKADGLRVDYADVKLKKGTTVTLTLKAVIDPEKTASDASGGIYINGKTVWKVNFSATGEWNTVSFGFDTDTTLSNIYVWQYDADSAYDIYVESIVIEDATLISSKTVTFTGAEAETYRKAFTYSGNADATLEGDTTYGTVLKRSGMWMNNSDGTPRGLIVDFANIEFTTDGTITIVVKVEGTSVAHNWIEVGMNDKVNNYGCNAPNGEWTTVTINVTAGTVLSSLYLNSTTNSSSFNFYVASIVIS